MSVVEIPQACEQACEHKGANWSEPVGYVIYLGFHDNSTRDVAYVTEADMRKSAEAIVKQECVKANAGAYPNLREVYMTAAAIDSDGKIHTCGRART
ncbi:hypothetical protein [Streptomyces cavernae]|uniref:hypothetical protein n=1 Tax=Streptomyces cavernae TaxID=2259034 RepID=UPI000FEBDA37|nr:hypothetical protein [Streptomyces cavernae]